MRRIPRDAVLNGWEEIANAVGFGVDAVQDIAAREDWPIVRVGEKGARVLLQGDAFHKWLTARSLGYSSRYWRHWIADRFCRAFERIGVGGERVPKSTPRAA